MAGYLAACGTYYADRASERCRACRGSGKLARGLEPCKCSGCVGGQHMTEEQRMSKRNRANKGDRDNSYLFVGRAS